MLRVVPRRLVRVVLVAALGVLALRPRAASAETITEAVTGVSFEAKKMMDGRSFTLIGTGVRKKLLVKVYAMGLYVEDVEGRRAFPSLVQKAGGREKAKLIQGDRAQAFVVWGQFGKVGVLRFVRDVGADKLRGAFEEGLGGELSEKAPADVREATLAFLKLCDRDVKAGEEVVVHTSADGTVELSIAGQTTGSVQNTKLVRALWGIWLGGRPLSKELRLALIDRIDALSN